MSNAHKDWVADNEANRERAKVATWCCSDCGFYWGECVDEAAVTYRAGKCEVCLWEGGVAHVRHFGWLMDAKADAQPTSCEDGAGHNADVVREEGG